MAAKDSESLKRKNEPAAVKDKDRDPKEKTQEAAQAAAIRDSLMRKTDRFAQPTLAVTAKPGARVFVDGIEVGVVRAGGFSCVLDPGAHKIEVKHGEANHREEIEVRPGELTTVKARLRAGGGGKPKKQKQKATAKPPIDNTASGSKKTDQDKQ